MQSKRELREKVREKYGSIAVATESSGCCGGGAATACCGDETTTASLEKLGYSAEQIASVPEGSDLGLGCGNPIDLAEAKPGETVLDLGSGAGVDCFLAAQAVGKEGFVIGVDMTPAMVEKARGNAERHGYQNVEFRLGEIENLPVADNSVDVIISNCVINLSVDKPKVFREAYRALKPGGRLAVSDLVLTKELPASIKDSVEAYVGCVAGASLVEDYLQAIRDAGFSDIEVVNQSSYPAESEQGRPLEDIEKVMQSVVSAKVRAIKK